ncbi:MAG: hypothetical protein OET79_09270, partial [Nitrospirota bacterium]|nr:hypothetical protein [Nitrospirota bacterium]
MVRLAFSIVVVLVFKRVYRICCAAERDSRQDVLWLSLRSWEKTVPFGVCNLANLSAPVRSIDPPTHASVSR